MLSLILTVLVVFLFVVAAEIMWHQRNLDAEFARKFVHISVGTFVAFWPLFLMPLEIAGLSLAFVAVVSTSYMFGIFKAIHSVQRPTWGEVFFALSVGVLAYIAHNGGIYTIALLHMSLADGLAAVIGTKFGKSTQYKVFGHQKSVVGTVTFMLVSAAIFAGFLLITGAAFSWWIVPIVLASAVLENLAVQGLDNLLVPALVAICLNALY